MAVLFPTWFDSVFRLAAFLVFFCVLAVPGLLMAWVRSPLQTGEGSTLAQPVQFDHRHHVRDDGIDCVYCHYDVFRSPTAGMPDTATCMGCHAQIWKDSPELEPVRRSLAMDTPIRWGRIYDLPDFVYFDHSIHVGRGVGCETCHGRVDRMASVIQAVPLTMNFCIECHRDPAPHSRPQSAITEMGYVPKGVSRAARDVRPPTYCTGCHR